MLIIGYRDVLEILDERATETVETVRRTYRLHDEGRSAVPHSTFLRFPDDARNRIIGLPAFVGGAEPAAGMKWIASFPGNLALGLPRANATVVLNSTETGRPEALLEGSLISAARTAASAAIAAELLTTVQEPRGITLIGCGVINLEVLRFSKLLLPSLTEVVLYDTDRARAEQFTARVETVAPGLAVTVAADSAQAMAAHPLISIATNAVEPHLDLTSCAPGTTVLHLSLRDLHPESLLDVRNVVDDPDHVCRERTSLHLAEQLTGNRDFIDTTVGALLRGTSDLRPDPDRVTVFSPFGLGVLDIALADLVRTTAIREKRGTELPDFLPPAVDSATSNV